MGLSPRACTTGKSGWASPAPFWALSPVVCASPSAPWPGAELGPHPTYTLQLLWKSSSEATMLPASIRPLRIESAAMPQTVPKLHGRFSGQNHNSPAKVNNAEKSKIAP